MSAGLQRWLLSFRSLATSASMPALSLVARSIPEPVLPCDMGMGCFWITATLAPLSAAARAAGTPDAPAPTTTTSKLSVSLISASAIGLGLGRKDSVAPPSELRAKLPLLSTAAPAASAAKLASPSAPTPAAPAAVREKKLRREMPWASTSRV